MTFRASHFLLQLDCFWLDNYITNKKVHKDLGIFNFSRDHSRLEKYWSNDISKFAKSLLSISFLVWYEIEDAGEQRHSGLHVVQIFFNVANKF